MEIEPQPASLISYVSGKFRMVSRQARIPSPCDSPLSLSYSAWRTNKLQGPVLAGYTTVRDIQCPILAGYTTVRAMHKQSTECQTRCPRERLHPSATWQKATHAGESPMSSPIWVGGPLKPNTLARLEPLLVLSGLAFRTFVPCLDFLPECFSILPGFTNFLIDPFGRPPSLC